MEKKGFKIIAIKPLTGCHPDYLKIVKENQLYYFYNNYNISSSDKISYTEVLPFDFYNINNIAVNISAIVGKNGSGKSTIIELLFRAINNIAQRQKGITTDLDKIPNLRVDLYFQTDSYYKIRINNSSIAVYGYDVDGNKIPARVENFSLTHFFYTIAVNYSHYAYNVNDMDTEVNWLRGLFHKNDGYQTPLVINPMRTDGNIDINNENHLAKSRLIGNLVRPVIKGNFSFRKLTNKLEATSLKLTLNKSKRKSKLYVIGDKKSERVEEVNIESLHLNEDEILGKLNKAYYFGYGSLNKRKYRLALDYVIYKMVSIAIKYDDYLEYFSREDKNFIDKKFDKFIIRLVGDESHITFKLRQTLNYLKYRYIELTNQTINLTILSNKINGYRLSQKRQEIIEFIPPPIFNIDIILESQDGIMGDIEFKKLSSGEKQMIYSVSSLLYHLINLNSITTNKKRIGYGFINIVLEEIELYFHPEMQRTYISYILDSIARLRLKRIRAINFCFVTHSPFILSDIPDSNILFLDDNGLPVSKGKEVSTFGGNIHELLAHSFFLGSGFIGEFAKRKIQAIINLLTNDGQNTIANNNPSKVLQEIEIVGEPFLKEKLLEMYYNKFQRQKRIVELRKELTLLENNDQTLSK